MWASDWPPLDLASDYVSWRRVSLALLAERNDDVRRRVLGATATDIYRLRCDTAAPGAARGRGEA